MNFNDYQEQTSKTNVYSQSIQKLIQPIVEYILEPDESKINEALHQTLKIKKMMEVSYVILGAVGETAELANKFKKVVRGDKTMETFTEEAQGEIGDSYWYLVGQLPTVLDLDAGELAQANLDKLFDRQNRGVLKGDGDNR